MNRRLRFVLGIVVMTLAVPLAFGACAEDPTDHILKDENGNDFNLLFNFWVSAEPGSGAYFSIGDAGGHFTTEDNETVRFKVHKERSYQGLGGSWLNEVDLSVTESESDMFDAGRTYYTTIFIYSAGGTTYLNLTIDDSLPYPTSGSPFPSSTFPLLREFHN